MSLYDDCIQDAKQYSSDSGSGFAVPVTITDSNGLSVTVNALHAKHHMAVDEIGVPVSSKTASIAISEQIIIDANPLFLIRNSTTKEVVMKGYKVVATDSAGIVCNYKILQQFPDETIGLLVFTLTDYR